MKKIFKKFFNFDFMSIILDLVFAICFVILGINSGEWIYYLCSGLGGISTILNGITWWLKHWK
jgi:hypothetical protein